MGLKLHQNKVALRILKEKNEAIILGEILHYIWEWILSQDRKILNMNQETEEFHQKIDLYIQKALAYYPEPLPQRKIIQKKVKEIIYKAFKSPEMEKLRELFSQKNLEVYKEAESFFLKNGEIQEIRPDLILKTSKDWIILEFKLHKDSQREEEQLENYQKFLKKLSSDANIKIYLIAFEPFSIEQKYVSSLSYPSQLTLFENIS